MAEEEFRARVQGEPRGDVLDNLSTRTTEDSEIIPQSPPTRPALLGLLSHSLQSLRASQKARNR